ncbi:D-cysteine desulfhydrase [bacterium BMS3Abin04]|nr:D-cysteine desulfhydrase [bacterium BMS3Abin04]
MNEIKLDPVYTGKMMYGIYDLISKEYFKSGSTIIAIHTGGLQGIEGMKPKIEKILNAVDS